MSPSLISDDKMDTVIKTQPTTTREINAWIFYNFGMETVSGVGMSVFIPLCINTMAMLAGRKSDGTPCTDFQDCTVSLGSLEFQPTSFTYYSISLSVAVQAFTFISIGALADYGSLRKGLLIWMTIIGSLLACLFLTAVSPELFWLAGIYQILLNVVFGCATVFYNAYLPVLVAGSPKIRDGTEDGEKLANQWSSRSYMAGYLGSVILLAINLGIVKAAGEGFIILQVCAFTVGIWWLIFSVWPLWEIKPRPGPPFPAGRSRLFFSWRKLATTLRKINKLPVTFYYLASYFIFSDAYSTISSVAVIFAETELNMQSWELGLVALITPFAALFGNYVVHKIYQRTGTSSKNVVIVCLLGIAVLPLYGILGFISGLPFGLKYPWEIYMLGVYFGFFLGPVQSFSRVTFAQLIPAGDESEFFSLYAITDKGSSWLGPLVIASITQATGGQVRYGFIFLLCLILVPLPVLLWVVKMDRGVKMAKEYKDSVDFLPLGGISSTMMSDQTKISGDSLSASLTSAELA